MDKNHSFTSELKTTLVLSVPIISGLVGQMILGLTDTIMIGRVGVLSLAASAFANSVLQFGFIFGIGILGSISVLVSHAFGRGKNEEIKAIAQRGVFLAFFYGVLFVGSTYLLLPLLHFMGQETVVVELSKNYLLIIASSMVFALILIALKAYTEAINEPWPLFWVGVFGVIMNIGLNWILIYGNLGFSALGLDGAGIATWIARFSSLFIAFLWLSKDSRFKSTFPKLWFRLPAWDKIKEMLSIGIPVAFQLFMEVGTFAMTTIIAGLFGATALAAHQIAISCAAMTFMVPLGLSIASTIRVGQVLGLGERDRARLIGMGSLGFSATLSLVFTAVLLFLNDEIVSFFTADPATIRLAAGLLVIAAIFQFFDGTQIVATGLLRGCKDVLIPSMIIGFAFVFTALGSSILFGVILDFGVIAIWHSLAVGLALGSVLLIARFIWVTRSEIGKHL